MNSHAILAFALALLAAAIGIAAIYYLNRYAITETTMNNIRYTLQYVNLIDGRTYYHYKTFLSWAELEAYVADEYDRWTSFEVVVTNL